MKKRLLSYFLVIAMVLTFLPTVAMAADDALQVSNDSISGEETVTVTYKIPNSVAIGTLEVRIGFDKAKLEATEIVWGTVAGFTGFIGSDHNEANTNGYFAGSCYSANFTDVTVPANQMLVTATFRIKDGATPGPAEFTVDELVITDMTFTDKSAAAGTTTTGAAVTVVSQLTGTLAITGVTAPVKNVAPVDKNAVNAPANTTITALTWSPSVNGTFAGETAYTATLNIKANDGYVFADGVSFTVDGESWNPAKQQDGSYNLTKTFPTTAGKDTPVINTAPTATVTYGDAVEDAALTGGAASVPGTFKWADSVTSYGDVGTKTLKAIFTPTDIANYTTVENMDVSVTVSAKNITVTIADIADQEYTGSQLKPTVTVTGNGGENLVLNTDYTVEYGTNVNVGTNAGSVTVKAKAGSNYTFTNTSKNFNIVAKAGQVTISGNLNVTYPNEVPNVEINQHGSTGATTVYYYTNEACTTGETTTKPTTAGSYWVKVKMAADANYGAAESNVIGFTISRADITPVVSITGWTYKGNANAPSVSGNTGNGSVTYQYKVKGANDNTYTTTVPTEAGDYTVKATVAQTTNYNGGSATADFKINPKDISGVTIADIAAQTYNNGTSITPTPAVQDGNNTLTVGTDFTYGYENNINVGNAAVKVIGQGNYTGTASKNFAISRADLTITVSITGWVVGGTPNTPTVTGNTGNGAVSYQYKVKDAADNTYTAEVPTAVGDYTVKATVEQTANYNAATATADFSISTKAPQTVTAENVTVTYGDTNKSVSAETNGNGTITYTVKSGSEFVEVNSTTGALTIKKVGTATITVTASETNTHAAATKDITVTVDPMKVTAPAADTTVFTYNGQNQTYGIAETTNYTVSNGVQKNAGNYTVTVALKDKVNTVWADSNNTTGKTFGFEIKKATITITVKNKSAYVNETAPTLGEGDYTVSGLASGENLKTLPTIAYESTPDMTKAGTVTIKVSGAEAPDGGNYNEIVYNNGTLSISTKPSGGGYYPTTYSITVEDAKNGDVSVSPKAAAKGNTVTVTVAPDKGYTLDTLTVTDKSGKEIELTNKGDGKYTFKMPASKVTVKTTFADDSVCNGSENCPGAKFHDINTALWYHEAVDYALTRGLMNGYGNNYFGPNDNLTRGMMMQIFYNLEKRPAVSGDMPFTDVSEDRYYADAIKWAESTGLVFGCGGGLFGPDDDITREQLAVILWRYAGSPTATQKELNFDDVGESSKWAMDALLWANENGVMNGNGNGILNPKGTATRAHVAQMLMNYLKNVL